MMSSKNSSEIYYFIWNCFVFTIIKLYDNLLSGVGSMFMNGEYIKTLNDLKRCFCIEELIYSYYNGELEFFLDKAGEHELAEKVRNITEHNAYLLFQLYRILDLSPEDSEEKIRQAYSSML